MTHDPSTGDTQPLPAPEMYPTATYPPSTPPPTQPPTHQPTVEQLTVQPPPARRRSSVWWLLPAMLVLALIGGYAGSWLRDSVQSRSVTDRTVSLPVAAGTSTTRPADSPAGIAGKVLPSVVA